jgi:hypothetical protein
MIELIFNEEVAEFYDLQTIIVESGSWELHAHHHFTISRNGHSTNVYFAFLAPLREIIFLHLAITSTGIFSASRYPSPPLLFPLIQCHTIRDNQNHD